VKPLFLQRLYLKETSRCRDEFPTNLPFVRSLDVSFTAPVTFFVEENGSVKLLQRGCCNTLL